MGLSKEERMGLAQRRRHLQDELRFLATTPKDSPALVKREETIRGEINEINKKLVED